ncbi:hypothetical protein MJC1_00087 [Methylocystis sp. MJC1]|nr:hypothetical protein MJC1_00087 [Methylocystis sp. MJC1]
MQSETFHRWLAEGGQVLNLKTTSLAAALCATVAASLVPASAVGGTVSVIDKASIGLPPPTAQADWRAYPHRHHRWHMGGHYGWLRGIGAYASSAPPAADGAASSACTNWGVLGAASPTCDSWGVSSAGYPACSCWSVYNPY